MTTRSCLRARAALLAANVGLLTVLAVASWRTIFVRSRPPEGARVPSYDPTARAIALERRETASFEVIAREIDRPPPPPPPPPPATAPAPAAFAGRLTAVLYHATRRVCIVEVGGGQHVLDLGDRVDGWACTSIEGRRGEAWTVRLERPGVAPVSLVLRPE